MANKLFHNQQYTSVPALVTLAGTMTLGAGPAIASQSFKGGTWTRTGTGAYTLTLDEVWPGGLVMLRMVPLEGTARYGVLALIEDKSNLAAKTVKVKILDAAGSAADLANGTVFMIEVMLKNSSVANG